MRASHLLPPPLPRHLLFPSQPTATRLHTRSSISPQAPPKPTSKPDVRPSVYTHLPLASSHIWQTTNSPGHSTPTRRQHKRSPRPCATRASTPSPEHTTSSAANRTPPSS